MNESRLKNYMFTAGGTAALAAAGAASAEIQTSSGSTPIPAGSGPSSIVNLFTIEGGVVINAIHLVAGDSTTGGANAALSAGTGAGPIWNIVSSGVSIDTGFTGSNYMYNLVTFKSGQVTNSSGSFALGTGNIVGFSIIDAGDTYYGWLEYDLALSSTVLNFTVNRWAYNDVANEGIIAGQNLAAGSTAVPGLGGLAALAIGAAGVRSRRQRTVA